MGEGRGPHREPWVGFERGHRSRGAVRLEPVKLEFLVQGLLLQPGIHGSVVALHKWGRDTLQYLFTVWEGRQVTRSGGRRRSAPL